MVNRKTPRVAYTREFKEEAVRLVESGLSMAEVARKLGMIDQTLFNWVKAKREGSELAGADRLFMIPGVCARRKYDFQPGR